MVGQTISPYGIVDGLGGGGMGVVYEAEDHPPCLLLFLLGEVVGDSQAWLLFSEKPKLLLLSIIPISAKSFARAHNVIVLVVEVNPCPAMQSTYFDNYLVLPGPSSVSQAISEEDSSRSRLAIKQPDIDHTIQKVPIPLFESRNKYNPRWKQPF